MVARNNDDGGNAPFHLSRQIEISGNPEIGSTAVNEIQTLIAFTAILFAYSGVQRNTCRKLPDEIRQRQNALVAELFPVLARPYSAPLLRFRFQRFSNSRAKLVVEHAYRFSVLTLLGVPDSRVECGRRGRSLHLW